MSQLAFVFGCCFTSEVGQRTPGSTEALLLLQWLFLFLFFSLFLMQPDPSSPSPPMSGVSITGNNRPSSFIVSWRWFPHGATGSLWCQPAGQPASQRATVRSRGETERIKNTRRLTCFLIVLQGDLTHGPRGGNIRDWYEASRVLSASPNC